MTTLERSQATMYASAPDATTLDALLVRFKRELYAIPVLSVREIMRHRPYTLVPGAPPTLPGIISQRGVIMPVVDVRLLLGFEAVELTSAARFVMVQHEDIDMALIIEAVLDLVQFPLHEIEAAPGALDANRAVLLSGVVRQGEQIIAILDPGAVVARLREEAA